MADDASPPWMDYQGAGQAAQAAPVSTSPAPPVQPPSDTDDAAAYANLPSDRQAGGANAAAPFAGATRDPRDPNVWRKPTGEVGYIYVGAPGGEEPSSDPRELQIDGSSDPRFIAGYLARHPELASAPGSPAAAPTPDSSEDGPWHDFAGGAGGAGAQPSTPPPAGSDAAVRASPEYQRLHASDAALEAAEDARSLKLPVIGDVGRFTSAIMPLPIGDEISGAVDAGKALLADGFGGHIDPRTAYLAGKDANQEASDAYRSAHPVSATVAGLLGAVPGPEGMLGPAIDAEGATRAAAAAGQSAPSSTAQKLMALAAETPKPQPGVVPLLQRYAGSVAKGALAGGAYGAAYGAADGTGTDRLRTAISGAEAGAALGAAVPGVLGPAAKLAGYAGQNIVAPAARTAVRGVNAMTGGALLDPAEQAASRMAESLSKDLRAGGPMPAQTEADWRASGASAPSYLDVAGENSRALQRTAASRPGPARSLAVGRTDQVTADLQPTMIGRTADLVPGAPSANDAQSRMELQRAVQADREYGAARADPVALSDAGHSALSDEPGRKAIGQAIRNAVANRDAATVDELRSLQSRIGAPQPDTVVINGQPVRLSDMPPALRAAVAPAAPVHPPVTAGSVDAVRQALNEMGEQAQMHGDNYAARGMFSRAADLDADLSHPDNGSPRYGQAKENYAAASERIDALKAGRKVMDLSSDPDAFASEVAKLSPTALQAARIGGRQALMDALGDRASNSTGLLNELATGGNVGRNLEALFGPEEAQRYRAAAGFENRKLQNARYVSPNTGSQTETRASDAGHHGAFPTSVAPHNIAATLLKHAFGEGRTLTEPEREAIVRMGQDGYAATIGKLADRVRMPKATPNLPIAPLLAHAGLEIKKTLSTPR